MSRPTRMTIAEAKRQVAAWQAEYEQHQRSTAINDHFRGVGASEVIRMWETGTNELGKKLTRFEFAALVERWCELFGSLPPDDDDAIPELDTATHPSAPEPADDTMLRMPEVVRLTDLS